MCSLDDHTAVAKQRRWGRYPSFHGHSNSGVNLDDEASHRGGAHSTPSPTQSKLKSRKQPLSRWVHAVLVVMLVFTLSVGCDVQDIGCRSIYASVCGEGGAGRCMLVLDWVSM